MTHPDTQLFSLQHNLELLARKILPECNMVVVRPIGRGIIFHSPYDSVFIVLVHWEQGQFSPSSDTLWQGSLPWDGTYRRLEEIYLEMESWMHAVVAEQDLGHKKAMKVVDINDPKFRYNTPRGDGW